VSQPARTLSRARAARTFLVAAAIGACAISPLLHDRNTAEHAILGTRPGYGPSTISSVPNLAAAGPLLWMPGLDDGWNPQGLAFVEGSLLISAYQSDRFGVNRGPCRVFRVDPVNGHETGHFDVPPPCGHAGGLAYAGDGNLYIADTHTLFEVDLARAFSEPAPPFRIFPLGPELKGALAASGPDEIWLGTYEEDRPGRIFKFDRSILKTLPDRTVLSKDLASVSLAIPSYAQGAALTPSGKLWVSRSEIGWGSLEKIDIARGRVEERYAAPGGIEGIAFGEAGWLWAVSEAGARHNRWVSPFFPVIFQLDFGRLTAGLQGSGD
jgi:hypothetical protein